MGAILQLWRGLRDTSSSGGTSSFEWAKFNLRKQEEGDAVNDFIMDLYCLAEHCSYGNVHDELVRDRIVVGLRSAALSEKVYL